MPWNMAGELGTPVSVRFDDRLASADIHASCFAQMLVVRALFQSQSHNLCTLRNMFAADDQV